MNKVINKEMIVQLKVTPVSNGGFIVKTFDTEGDQRIPILTLVAENLDSLQTIIKSLYS